MTRSESFLVEGNVFTAVRGGGWFAVKEVIGVKEIESILVLIDV